MANVGHIGFSGGRCRLAYRLAHRPPNGFGPHAPAPPPFSVVELADISRPCAVSQGLEHLGGLEGPASQLGAQRRPQ